MAPSQHLDWFEENVRWFEALKNSDLAVPVPSCPGWSVENVVNHLAIGLGLGYPIALSKPPDTAASEAFVGIARPDDDPIGQAALDSFSYNMGRCVSVFRATPPDTPCWTYAGPGSAKFWFRRAAIETALHRMDVEDALASGAQRLADDRAEDALVETLEFALPLAADLIGWPDGRIRVESPDLNLAMDLGHGARHAVISGHGLPALLALWGRSGADVEITGDQALAGEWLTAMERAFAGR